jgi:hypothetical protein
VERKRKKAKYYEMHKVQVSVLRKLAGDKFGTIGIYNTLPDDDPAIIAGLEEDRKLTQDLLDLGLLEDLSEKYAEDIKKDAGKFGGRTHRVLHITEMGRLMFDYCDDPECTVHKLGCAMRRYPC